MSVFRWCGAIFNDVTPLNKHEEVRKLLDGLGRYMTHESERQKNEVSNARRQGDIDPDTAIIADTMKVIGNSAFGSLIMNKENHRVVQYVHWKNETCLKINDPRVRNLDYLNPEEQYYELEMAKQKIKLDLPIQLGYFILQYAKLRMLEFYYDFMDVYVDRADFEYCEIDTDSAYMAISGFCVEEVIKPETKQNYLNGLNGFCTDDLIEADSQYHWFPHTCCTKHTKYDKRTPGLFKLEYQGEEMIGLCSKTYFVRKSKTIKPSLTRIAAYHLLTKSLKLKRKRWCHKQRIIHDLKFSSKGVSKRCVKAPMTKFRRALKTRIAQSGLNRGFRVRNNHINTYTQERRRFSYFYWIRKALDNGIHTEPLDITLCPMQATEVDDQELIDILSSKEPHAVIKRPGCFVCYDTKMTCLSIRPKKFFIAMPSGSHYSKSWRRNFHSSNFLTDCQAMTS